MRNGKMAPCLLNINVEMVNCDYENDTKTGFSMGDSTFRQDGFSIGPDYLRLEGRTLSRGELAPSSLSIQELVGEGAFTKVHRGTWKRKNANSGSPPYEAVAVKQCCVIESSLQRQEMLLKELRALCLIECESLVKLKGAFLEDGTVTMVLEYMDKGSFEQLLAKKPKLEDSFIASTTYQILKGLSYLHRQRIIHRDIKPGNCLLHSDGSIKLCDFGLSSLSDQSLQTTVVGTTRYMAPERLRSKPYGRSSDIWSIGLVVLECITGRPPWKEVESIVSLVVTVEEANIDDLFPKDLPCHVQEFLLGCLRHQPESRIPAEVLLKSPWFLSTHSISSLVTAKTLTKRSFR